MRIKFSDQVLVQAFTFADGVNQDEIDLPELAAGDAFVLRDALACFDAASAAPSITDAGLALFAAAITGKEQVSPSDLLDLEKLLWHSALSVGSLGAAPLYSSNNWSGRTADQAEARSRFAQVPTREAFLFGHTVNVTNAATTIMRFRIRYDIVSLTGAEQLAYLL